MSTAAVDERAQLALTDEALLGQLDGEPPGNLLQLIILHGNTRLLGYKRRRGHQNGESKVREVRWRLLWSSRLELLLAFRSHWSIRSLVAFQEETWNAPRGQVSTWLQLFKAFRLAACTFLSVHVGGLEEKGEQQPYAVVLGVDLDSGLCSSKRNIWRRRIQASKQKHRPGSASCSQPEGAESVQRGGDSPTTAHL